MVERVLCVKVTATWRRGEGAKRGDNLKWAAAGLALGRGGPGACSVGGREGVRRSWGGAFSRGTGGQSLESGRPWASLGAPGERVWNQEGEGVVLRC